MEKITRDDMLNYLTGVIKNVGLVNHNIIHFNNLLDTGISHILTTVYNVHKLYQSYDNQSDGKRTLKNTTLDIRFRDVRVAEPMFSPTCNRVSEPLYPNQAIRNGGSYSGTVYAGADVILTGHYSDGSSVEKKVPIDEFKVMSLPIMVMSNKCNLPKLNTRSLRRAYREDPDEFGGFVIVKGHEYTIDGVECVLYNAPHIHKEKIAGERVRAEIISQDVDAYRNSTQLIVIFTTSGHLLIEITAVGIKKVRLPFYVLYRLFGMPTDTEIFETIVGDIKQIGSSGINKSILDTISKARSLPISDKILARLQEEFDEKVIIDTIHMKAESKTIGKSEEEDQYRCSTWMKRFDDTILPHEGKTKESRINKLRYIGYMINKMLLVLNEAHPETDRHSYRNKRIDTPGVALAKVLKTQLSEKLMNQVFNSIRTLLQQTKPFTAITLPQIHNSFMKHLEKSTNLSDGIKKAITGGNADFVINGRVKKNRMSTEAYERKNMTHQISTLRTVSVYKSNTASKQTKQACDIRRVHTSTAGFLCPTQSADSDAERVGMKKQLACTIGITSAGSVPVLMDFLGSDSKNKIIPVVKLIHGGNKIFVNGKWIGYSDTPAIFAVQHYREMRRKGKISPHCTIFYDELTNDIEFWLDSGRPIRPLIIVYNNIVEYDRARREAFEKKDPKKKIKFDQHIKLTREHINDLYTGKITLDALRKEGIIEFIAPTEQINCLIAKSVFDLVENRNNILSQYTHCEVEQAIFGFPVLSGPFGDHGQGTRITMQSNHVKQGSTWSSIVEADRLDHERFHQLYLERPLIETVAARFIRPGGYHMMVAYTFHEGDNQEDSGVFNKASSDSGMFAGLYYQIFRKDVEGSDEIIRPDSRVTMGIRQDANYSKLGPDGIITIGSIVVKNDVLIAARTKLQFPRDKILYIENDVIYNSIEPGYVETTVKDSPDKIFALVKVRNLRFLGVGTKLCTRFGNKIIASRAVLDSDMPFTPEGYTFDVIANPHSFPTRMPIGQASETSATRICAATGKIADCTTFSGPDFTTYGDELVKHGYRKTNVSTLLSGMTGEIYDKAVCTGSNYFQRIQLYVEQKMHVPSLSSLRDQVTRQPIKSKGHSDCLKIGEMESNVLGSHGVARNITEKCMEDSDGCELYLCRNCGRLAIYNREMSIYICKTCASNADIARVGSTTSTLVRNHELESSGIGVQMFPKPYEFMVQK